MQKKTIEGVTLVLNTAANILKASGRPRKPLGKPRPVQSWDQVSLPKAIRDAVKWHGLTDHVRRQTLYVIYDAVAEVDDAGAWRLFIQGGYTDTGFLRCYDNEELDTREIIRTLNRAKKIVAQAATA